MPTSQAKKTETRGKKGKTKKATKKKTNPNGANQYRADPRNQLFFSLYFDPENKETFGNATKSGLKAGFTKTYSQNLLNRLPKWLLRKVEEYDAEIPDELVLEKHRALLNQNKVEYFTFSKKEKDEDIREAVEEAGFKVITIKNFVMGKMAFYSVPDSKAVGKGVEMAYKIKGRFQNDKPTNVFNTLVLTNEQASRIARRIADGNTPSAEGGD